MVNWLTDEDMLPSILPAGRVLEFGLDISALDAAIDFDSAAINLKTVLLLKRVDRSSRPIVFIGHGYGTVVIQKLLSESYGKESYASDLGSTAAVFFFAPPFRGSEELNKWTTGTLSISESKIFAGLGSGSPKLQQIWKQFVPCSRDPNIFVFVYLPKGWNTVERRIREERGKIVTLEDLKAQVDLVHVTSSDVGGIAQFSGPKDHKFHSITRLILKTVQTRQLLGAAEHGDEDMLTYAINHSIDVNLHNKADETALHIAAKHGELQSIRALLSSGKVDIDHQDSYGRTALHQAVLCQEGNKSRPMVEELLKAGADPWIEDTKGVDPDTLSKDPRINIATRRLFEKRPLVEGPPAIPQSRLVRKMPPQGDATEACHETEMVATEVFFITGDKKPEKHLPNYPQVDGLIYSDAPVDDNFQETRRRKFKKKPFCRWYHIPTNNVSSNPNFYTL